MNNMKQIGLAMIKYMRPTGHFPAGLHCRQEDRQAALELAGGDLAVYRAARTLSSSSISTSRGTARTTRSCCRHGARGLSQPGQHSETGHDQLLDRPRQRHGVSGQGRHQCSATSRMACRIRSWSSRPSDAKAVPWTKPDDLRYDEKHPAAGLGGLLPGGFNAAFCDGSVRIISRRSTPRRCAGCSTATTASR